MHKIRHIAYALLAASLLNACTREDSGYTAEVDGAVLTFTVGIDGTATRSSVDNYFENGDAISVTINEEEAITYHYDGSAWTTDSPYYWKSTSDEVTVEAECFGGKAEGDYAVQADQSEFENYQAGDYLYAPATRFTYQNQASNSLTFYHQTAKLVLNLVDGDGGALSNADDVEITIGDDNIALTGSFAKPTDGSEFGTWTPGEQNSSITPYKLDSPNTVAGKTIYESRVALAVPQSLAAGSTLISIVIDGQGFYYKPSNDITWNPGKVYTYTITVKQEGLEVETSITDWVEDDSIDLEMLTDYTVETIENVTTYIVYSANGLLAWNKAASNDTSISCTLADDIDLTGSEWTPVGNNSKPYTGTFEGGGHTIKGLTFNDNGTNYVGLIGYLGSGCVVQNLTLENVNITGYRYVGGVVGRNDGTVTNCSVSGNVSGDDTVGGVVGGNYGTVTACSAFASVPGIYYVGGVVGCNYSGGSVTASYASGSISGNQNVGGVVGENYKGTVTACYHASGSVESSGSYIGGVVGQNYGGTVTDCYWSDYDGNGIGQNNGSGSATKVEGEVTWSDAVGYMNEAIDDWNEDNSDNPEKQCDWQYEIADGETLPTLTKK